MAPDATPLVRHVHDRGITTVTLDSPHNRNALSAQLVGELHAALAAAGADDATRAISPSARLFSSAEAREGMTAFLERRDPAWVL